MSQPEAFSRILIDKALEFSDWNLLNPQQIQFKQHTGNGRADYLLKDSLGRMLCVLEAKREGLDPYDAKEQARGYAEQLSAPFIILSNGREHWFWNHERVDQRDAYHIERLLRVTISNEPGLRIFSRRVPSEAKSSHPSISASSSTT